MSELKDYSILDIEAIDDERYKKEASPGKWVPESRVYLKSEADKVIAEKDKEIAELKMKLAGAKRNCKNCLQCHEIEDKGSFYKVFCKQVGHWVMWNKEDNCTEFLPKEDEE